MRISSPFRGYPPPFLYLVVGTFINRLGGFVVPFLAIYLTRSQHYSVERVGFVTSLWGIGLFGAGPLGGYLADRIGRRKTLLLALCLGASSVLFLGFATTIISIAIGAFFVGLFGEMYRPAVFAAVADLIPSERRTEAYGWIYWAVNVGFSVSTIIAGLLASVNFKLLFIADAATTLGYAVLVFYNVPESRPTEKAEHPLSLRAPLGDIPFLGFVFLSFLVATVFFQSQVALPVEMQKHGIGPTQYGFLISINGILVVLLQPIVSRYIRAMRISHALALSWSLTGIGYGLTGLAGGIPVYALSIVIWTLGEICGAPVASTLIAELAPKALRGSYQGTYQLSWGAAAFVAPLAGSFIIGRFGGAALWIGCLITGLVTAVAQIGLISRLRR